MKGLPIITPDTYLGPMLTLCNERRGIQKDMIYLDTSRVELVFEMPLAEAQEVLAILEAGQNALANVCETDVTT